MPLKNLKSKNGGTRYTRDKGIMKGDLIRYQQMQLAIDLLLHILQSFQLRPFAQTIGLAQGNHEKSISQHGARLCAIRPQRDLLQIRPGAKITHELAIVAQLLDGLPDVGKGLMAILFDQPFQNTR